MTEKAMYLMPINEFYASDYVNIACGLCTTRQGTWVVHDDENKVHAVVCNRCLAEDEPT
jgi:hypothetical protein